jgi:ATP-dependent Clp protease adaptor protein ClpS
LKDLLSIYNTDQDSSVDSPDVDELLEVALDVDLNSSIDTGVSLVVYNDEVNTFDWVIESLVKICSQNSEQAEQCAYLIHYQGRYAVKHGNKRVLNPMRRGLADRGISATLE